MEYLQHRCCHLTVLDDDKELIGMLKEISNSETLCSDLVLNIIPKSSLDANVVKKTGIIVLTLHNDKLSILNLIKSLNPNISILVFINSSNLKQINSISAIATKVLLKPYSFDILKQTLLDIIEIRVLNKNYLESKQYDDILFNSFIISKTDTRGIITYVNELFCKISGFSEEELIGMPHNIVRHVDTPIEVFKDLWQTIKAKKTWNGRIKNSKKDGGFYIVDAIVVPILDVYGEIVEYISIRQDVTDLEFFKNKAIQEEQKAQLEELQNRSLEEISKAKDSFLVIFTHELKTPLNAIINFSDYVNRYLQKAEFDKKDKILNLLEALKETAYLMLDNVTNILDLAKLKSKKLNFNYSTFSIISAIEEVHKHFQLLIVQNKIDVVFNKGMDCYIYSDEYRFKQIISNIYSNAIKYGKGQILIDVSCKDNILTVKIDDNGDGIEDKVKVFEMFEFDKNIDIKRDAKGTGIGLTFVKLLCEELGFLYEIQKSEILGGTSFRIIKDEVR